MDAQVLRRYVARLTEFGLPERVFLIVGLAPLASARSARWIRDKLFGSIIPEPLIARLEAAADPEGRRGIASASSSCTSTLDSRRRRCAPDGAAEPNRQCRR